MIAAPCSQTRKPSWLLGPDSFHIPLIYKPTGQHPVSLVTLLHSLDSALTPPFLHEPAIWKVFSVSLFQ